MATVCREIVHEKSTKKNAGLPKNCGIIYLLIIGGKIMKFKVYYKLNCPKCRLTIAQLKQLPVKVSKIYVDVTDTSADSQLSKLKQAGYQSFPVVKVFDHEQQIDEWSDFKINKINKWKQALLK